MKRILFAVVMTGAMFLQGCGSRQFSKGEYDDVENVNLMNDTWSETDMQKAVAELVAGLSRHRSIAEAKKHLL
jgi:PBP1b-binding outer membrane lipoprotein LpoB